MPKLVKGPFQLRWGTQPILQVSELTFNYDVASNDYETLQGQSFTLDGAITASIELTLLASDVDSLSTLFPAYYKAAGETLSTGDVAPEGGAIDIVAAQCDDTTETNHLEVTSCNGEVLRLVNAKASLTAVNIDNNILRTVGITFRGEPAYDAQGNPFASVQFLGQSGS